MILEAACKENGTKILKYYPQSFPPTVVAIVSEEPCLK